MFRVYSLEVRVKLVTCRDRDGHIYPGVLLGEEIIDISDEVVSIGELIEAGPELLPFVRDSLPVAQFTGIGLLHRWLRPGEIIVTEIQGIGQLVNPVVAEA
jgi:hypothetical protein